MALHPLCDALSRPREEGGQALLQNVILTSPKVKNFTFYYYITPEIPIGAHWDMGLITQAFLAARSICCLRYEDHEELLLDWRARRG